jgi:hypothetical protein
MDPYIALSLAVIKLACREARRADRRFSLWRQAEARSWLQEQATLDFIQDVADVIGADVDAAELVERVLQSNPV